MPSANDTPVIDLVHETRAHLARLETAVEAAINPRQPPRAMAAARQDATHYSQRLEKTVADLTKAIRKMNSER